MTLTHHILIAFIMSFGATFAGLGIGVFSGWILGQTTPNRRGYALLIGIFGGLASFFAFIWLAYNGYRI